MVPLFTFARCLLIRPDMSEFATAWVAELHRFFPYSAVERVWYKYILLVSGSNDTTIQRYLDVHQNLST